MKKAPACDSQSLANCLAWEVRCSTEPLIYTDENRGDAQYRNLAEILSDKILSALLL